MTPAATTTPSRLAMRIVAACVPDLQAGKYDVTVRQTVKHDGKEISKKDAPTFTTASTFWVSAPRFSLASSEVYAMYPPADARGHFSETLPHIVFRRRTLPWERGLTGAGAGPVRPWIALLLLAEDELGLNGGAPLRPRPGPVKEVVADRPPTFAPPAPWEPEDGPCQILELPKTLFEEIAPAWDDLPYLAHARQVGAPEHLAADGASDAEWKAPHIEAEGIEDAGWFSVVVGNRLPAPGKEHHAYLVSLEGLEGRLRRESGQRDSVHLVVLTSWRFTDNRKGGFKELVTTGLSCGPMRSNANASAIDPTVRAALELGYAPLEHQTRAGHRTVSWYRGPLVPHVLPSPGNVAYRSADAALRYDPEQGLLDVSYAAAWQLGRLLGLQNRPFAGAVHRLKLATLREARAIATRKTLEKRFGSDLAKDWDQIVRAFFEKHPGLATAVAPHADGDPSSGSPDPSVFEEALGEAAVAAELPVEIRQFLGRLFLLHGVPSRYLVPHPAMLGPGSLRIFYLDTGWIAALIDGALSIGRVSESTFLLDKAMAGNFLKDVVRDEVDPSIKEVTGHLTGFLLRSALVSGWRGMEIRASDARGLLTPLRLQRIADDTLLALYPGRIARLVIAEPPHGVHFGVTGTADRTRPEVVRMWQRARDQKLADKPAEFAGGMLERRVEHTIDVTIDPDGASS